MKESKSDGAKLTQPAREQAAIHWDDSGIKNSYANACTVSSTREEIVLNFGLNHTWERGQQDAKVQLTNRVILNPHTAKQLAMLLGAIIQQYEKQFGALEIGTPQPQANPAAENKPHVVK